MPLASTNIDNDPDEALGGSAALGTQKSGALGQMRNTAVAGGTSPHKELQGALTKQIAGLEESRTKKKAIIDEAIANLSKRQAESGPSAEELFRLMGAFAQPTKTGSFFESLGGVGNTAADILGKRRENAASLQDLATKYQLQGIDVDSEHLKQTIDAMKGLQAANAPASVYGKTAQDEGLVPGSPEFNARVQELATQDMANKTAKAQGPQLGQFDTKTGNYVAPNGTVIKAPEIKSDRENRDAMVKLQDSLKKLTPDVVKKAEGWDWTGSDTSKFIAGKFMPKQLAAQTTVNAASLQERLKNLPPGPASDKDIAQARSSFPGFADAKALQQWIDFTNDAINNYIGRQDQKYGDAQWYGASGTPGKKEGGSKPEEKTPEGKPSAPSAAANPAPQQSRGTPKVGAVLNGQRFKGGNPNDRANWEPA